MSAFSVREAVIADIPLILSFIRKLAEYEKLAADVVATEEMLRQQLFGDSPKAHVVFAVVEGVEVGFALYFYNFSTFLGRAGLYVEDIFVDEAHRGKGIGKGLYGHLAAKAVGEGCGRMEWWVLNWNTPSIAFYEGIGARPMSEWTVYRLDGPELKGFASNDTAKNSS